MLCVCACVLCISVFVCVFMTLYPSRDLFTDEENRDLLITPIELKEAIITDGVCLSEEIRQVFNGEHVQLPQGWYTFQGIILFVGLFVCCYCCCCCW